ncbi:MAG: vWA domain-containing protein [Ruminococcus sp.]|nr:vWA domain-containing protein [Ruminococcus sp.]
MKKNLTELVFILDKSGSMAGLEADTIGGFNSMLKNQKKQDGEAFVTTVLFDNEIQTVHDRIPLDSMSEMTDDDYVPGGCTALIDAIGKTIEHIKNIHKYARKDDVPESTVFVITTDGMENASREFSSAKVKKMIEKQKSEGWEFLFIAANIDAVETASGFGIDIDRAVNYHADKKGTGVLFEAVGAAIGSMRKQRTISKEWSAEIEDDFKSR